MEVPEKETVLLLVGSATSVPGLAGSIAEFCRNGVDVTLRSVGAGAVSQAIKACAVARTMLAGQQELRIVPMFETIQIGGQNRSAIVLVVETVELMV